MKLQTTKIVLPAYWASALINGEDTGLNDDDVEGLENWLEGNPDLGQPHDVGKPYLGWYEGKITDVAEYTFPVIAAAK